MRAKANYERPKVQTMPASRILDLLGPISCGSSIEGQFSTMGTSGSGSGSGWSDLQGR